MTKNISTGANFNRNNLTDPVFCEGDPLRRGSMSGPIKYSEESLLEIYFKPH